MIVHVPCVLLEQLLSLFSARLSEARWGDGRANDARALRLTGLYHNLVGKWGEP
jgi:predicted 2-oxoglutarate/Fe(II)-dependent dioxygenase YbiX